jgi:hypothetical protein
MSEWLDAIKILAAAFALMTGIASWLGYDGYQANQDADATRQQMTTVVNHYHGTCK